jgi:phage protein D
MTSALYTSAAPVFQVDGEVRGELGKDLMRLEVEESTGGLKSLSARFVAQGSQRGASRQVLLYLNGEILDFGRKLQVSIGPAEGARLIFDGLISGIEAEHSHVHEPRVSVFAEDRLMKLRMTRRMKTYRNMSDADIANAIASEHGLRGDAEVDGPKYDVVQQWNMSDLAFLRERGARLQAEIWLEEDRLCFKTRNLRSATEVTLVMGNELLEARVRADLAHQRTKIKLGGYDAMGRAAIDVEAGKDAIAAEVTEGRSGVDILEQAFGERESYRVREVPLNNAEATAWARAEMLRRARSFVTICGTTSGTPDMVVGTKVTLEGCGRPFDGGGYYATRVCHTYDLSSGHRTHFEAERPTIQEGA